MVPAERLSEFIIQNNLFDKEDRILLAVSGGKDSVLLAHLFRAAEVNFGIAHCNFCLRGEEADADEMFVQELAGKLKVPFYSVRFDTASVAAEEKISIQMAARRLRYDWFESVRQECEYNYIATAHHQNDVVETILLNLVRGTGISGLHGILPKRGKLIRPLLFLTAKEIEELIDDSCISYREDSSNFSAKYARNRLRLEVIPKLKEMNPALEETFRANSKRFEELELLVQQRVEELRPSLFKSGKKGTLEIEISALQKLEPKKLLLYELLKQYNFKENIIEDLLIGIKAQPGKLFQSLTHSILLDRNKLILSERKIAELKDSLITEGDESVLWNSAIIRIQVTGTGDLSIEKNCNKAYVDSENIIFPLKIRSWHESDFFYPFGMKGKKKLSDFFTSLKIPLDQKKEIPVVENSNGEIIWIAGLRSDDRYRITEQTGKVYIFELLNPDGK